MYSVLIRNNDVFQFVNFQFTFVCKMDFMPVFASSYCFTWVSVISIFSFSDIKEDFSSSAIPESPISLIS